MPDTRGVLTVREVAQALGVSVQRVRKMISEGSLEARRTSAGWLIAEDAVAARTRIRRYGRPIQPRTAWAAIVVLSAASRAAEQPENRTAADFADVVSDRRLRHQVRRILAALPDPRHDDAPWLRLLASRGAIRRLWAHPGVLARVNADPRLSPGGAAAVEGHGLSGGREPLTCYVGGADSQAVVQDYRLRNDLEANVSLVVVPASVPAPLSPRPGQPAPTAAAVADLLDEPDPRARAVALDQLHRMHQALAEPGSTAAKPDTRPGAPARTTTSGGR